MKANEFDLEDVTVKRDTVVIDFNTDSCNVSLQVSKDTLLTYICDEQLNVDTINDYVLDAESYLAENLRDVVKSYLIENL
jgi:hypothetical protein